MSRPHVVLPARTPVARDRTPVVRVRAACTAVALALLAALALASSAPALGSCSISGTVRNGEGQAWAGLGVRLYDQSGAEVAAMTSESGGEYSFTSLDPGTYRVGFTYWSGGDLYLPSFYRDAVTLDDADPITLTEEAPAFTGADGVIEWAGYQALPQGRPDGSWGSAEQWDLRGGPMVVSGDVAAVGTPYTYHAGVNQSGAVYIYVRGALGWRVRQIITSPSPVPYGYFGRALDLDGDTLLVAQYEEDAQYAKPGRVWVYALRGSTFRLQDELVAGGDAALRGGFGQSVAVDGDAIVVGSPWAKPDGRGGAGAAYVFTRSGDDWAQLQRLTQNTPEGDSFFGDCVALQGGLIVVGAPQEDTAAGVGAGAVYAFRRGETTWGAGAKVRPDDAHIGDGFGTPLALDGDTLLVTAEGKDDWGAVYAFVRGSGGWSQQAILPQAKRIGTGFGRALDLRGDEALVGWPGADGEVSGAGASGGAYAYRRSGSTWHRIAELGYEEAYRQLAVGSGVALAGGDFLVSSGMDTYFNESRVYKVRVYRPYVCEAGSTLTVPASRGLLSNDSWPVMDTPAAEPLTDPTHGAYVGSADGSFSYTPAPGFIGSDAFTYRLTSTTFTAADATPVTIYVRDSSAPTVSVDGVARGWVSAPVTVVLDAEDATRVKTLDYRRTTATQWQRYLKPFRVSREGATPYRTRATDTTGNARLGGFTVRVDTRRPSVSAPYAATGKAGGQVTFRFKVSDPRPGGPWADVTIEAFKRAGSQGSVTLKRQPVNRLLSRSVQCWLPRGTYRFVVTVKDAAGNAQRSPASNRLVVK